MAITQINPLQEAPALNDLQFSEKMFILANQLRNEFVPKTNQANAEVDAIHDDIVTKHADIESDANRASDAKADAQAAANASAVSAQASATAVDAAESARDAAILAASEVGALEVAKMQSYNNQQAMAYFDLNPL